MGRILIGNIKGPQGEAGKNFEYAKTYASVSAMNADFSGTDVAEGEYVVISAGIDDADNGRVYRKGTNSYVYVNRVNGPTGPRGATGPMPTLVNNLNTTTAGQGALDAAVGPTIDGKVTGNGGEAGDTIATFTTSDTTTASEIIEYTDMDKLTSGSPLKTLMSIMSKAVKNVRWFQKLLGTTDISGIGNGTVTNAVSTLNDAYTTLNNAVYNHTEHPVSINSNFENFSWEALVYYKIGKIVFVHGAGTWKGTANPINVVFATGLPKPRQNTSIPCALNASSNSVNVVVSLNGELRLYAASMATNASFYVCLSYVEG